VEHAELVALGVGQDDEPLAPRLPDVCADRTEREQPLDLRVDPARDGTQVGVQPVLLLLPGCCSQTVGTSGPAPFRG
jgi:hypothetical protein